MHLKQGVEKINMEMKTIGKKIKDQRIRKNISQEKLAELIDVTPSYISNLESGNRIASLPTMLDIVNVLDLSFDFLMLDDMIANSKEIKIDKNLAEFKNILEELEDKQLIQEYLIYCKGIANSMLEIKKINPKKTS
jgi:transcriptional regulator with XRE-family HTH domain